MSSEIALAKQGDERAFARLVDRFAPKLFRFVRRFAVDDAEAEDICQETFMKVHGALDRVDTSRPFAPWIYRIASNAAISRVRKRRRQAVSLGEIVVPCGRPGAEVKLEQRDRCRHVRLAIDGLSPRYREVCVLYYLEEKDVARVAEVLQIPIGTAKVRLFRARAILRERLGPLLGPEDHTAAAASAAATPPTRAESGDR